MKTYEFIVRKKRLLRPGGVRITRFPDGKVSVKTVPSINKIISSSKKAPN